MDALLALLPIPAYAAAIAAVAIVTDRVLGDDTGLLRALQDRTRSAGAARRA